MKDANKSRREIILDAAEQCFDRWGMQKTTLADIAEAAEISRMTLYRHFKDRQALLEAAIIRNIGRQWQQVSTALADIEELDEWLIEAILFFKRELVTDETLLLYSRLGAFQHGIEVALTEPGLEPVVSAIQTRFDVMAAQNRIPTDATAEDIAEWAHRMNHSLIAAPGERLQCTKNLRRWLSSQVKGGLIMPREKSD